MNNFRQNCRFGWLVMMSLFVIHSGAQAQMEECGELCDEDFWATATPQDVQEKLGSRDVNMGDDHLFYIVALCGEVQSQCG